MNPKCDALFQRPLVRYGPSGVWYANRAVGKNILDIYMKRMSEVGELSKVYTNHCIRRTCVGALDSVGYKAQDIMTVTGHRHSGSLTPYLGKPSLDRKHAISESLHAYGQEKNQLDLSHTVATGPTGISRSHVSSQSVFGSAGQSRHSCARPSASAALGAPPHDHNDVARNMSSMVEIVSASQSVLQSGDGVSEIVEVVQQSSQCSQGENSVTTNTAISVERKTAGSLFAGATLTNCVFNINVQK